MPNPADIKKNVEQTIEKMKSVSVEKDILAVELIGASANGYYFSITDNNPKPNEYKFMTQGMFRLGELLVTFTVLTNDGAERVKSEMIAALQTAIHVQKETSSYGKDAIIIKEVDRSVEISVPVSKLTLVLPKKGLSQKLAGNVSSNRYFMFVDDTQKLNVSGRFEPERRFRGTKQLWESDLGARVNTQFGPSDVSFAKIGNWDTVSYIMPITSKLSTNVRAHWVQSGTWIELHLSTSADIPASEQIELIRDFVLSLQVKEKP